MLLVFYDLGSFHFSIVQHGPPMGSLHDVLLIGCTISVVRDMLGLNNHVLVIILITIK